MELPAAVPGDRLQDTAESDIPPLPAADAYVRVQGTSIHGQGLLEDYSTGLTSNMKNVTANEVGFD